MNKREILPVYHKIKTSWCPWELKKVTMLKGTTMAKCEWSMYSRNWICSKELIMKAFIVDTLMIDPYFRFSSKRWVDTYIATEELLFLFINVASNEIHINMSCSLFKIKGVFIILCIYYCCLFLIWLKVFYFIIATSLNQEIWIQKTLFWLMKLSKKKNVIFRYLSWSKKAHKSY